MTESARLWAESEKLFTQADLWKPEKDRFKGWKPSQNMAFESYDASDNERRFLFFPTGEGKSKTALGLVCSTGIREVVIIAPPKTHSSWLADAATLGLNVVRIHSFEKFRMKDTLYPKGAAWIVDEYHKLGGHGAEGFKKFSKMMAHFSGPLIGCSATPNYNDYDRVFCTESVFDPRSGRNYGDWILGPKCVTTPNRYAYYPDVVGLTGYADVLDYFSKQSWVSYIEDRATWNEVELVLKRPDLDVFERLGYDHATHRIVNSDMEKRHKRVDKSFIDPVTKEIRHEIWSEIIQLAWENSDRERWMIVCAHKTVAEALYKSFKTHMHDEVWLITGDTTDINPARSAFVASDRGVLIGTTALAEGVDGLDKACQTMLILDDIVGDDAKRRQLIGRILPRGAEDSRVRLVVRARFSDQPKVTK